MQYNIEKLLEAVDQVLEAHRKNYDAQVVSDVEAEAAAVEQWVATWGDRWAAAVKSDSRLRKAIRGGKPVTEDMLPTTSNYGRNVATYSPDSRRNRSKKAYAEPAELVALRRFLGTITDETVSSSALRDVGFRNLSHVFTYATQQ